jgi:L-threonylcarbamoyladenylate synthase
LDFLSPDDAGVRRAAEILRGGEVIAFPTDTVYGLAAILGDVGAVERIFEIKGRPRDRRLVAMVADRQAAARLAHIDERARLHMERWWPGPLTLVLPGAAGGTVAVRIPNHELALALLRKVGEPLATTSANLSGQPPALTAGECRLPGVAAVLDGGSAPGGTPSTLLDLTGVEPRVLREGPIRLPPTPTR